MPADNTDNHERTGPSPVAGEHAEVLDVLEQALDAADSEDKNYYVREALQYVYLKNREEIAGLLNDAIDAEDADSTDFLVREVIELLDIETQVTSVGQTGRDGGSE
ncbi:hypothetical protein [Haloarcula nitratireducens]|uniref:Transcriptional regulator n=1 Tax=Haloarcula nitratireducens TaxID=2487749 RepID=A0AAW4P8S6_9EURY|nr:hypothetical protein [Halomicroarcula nitratireducens]MBX0294274.1 hypothetical protein [Halomicroarcula nitratireducens]